jgi:hypothetical protein
MARRRKRKENRGGGLLETGGRRSRRRGQGRITGRVHRPGKRPFRPRQDSGQEEQEAERGTAFLSW